jgi:hypothetical protein
VNNTTGAGSGATVTQPTFGTLTVAYDAGADSYTVNDGTTSSTFGTSDRNGSDTAFQFYLKTLNSTTTSELSVFKSGSANGRLALTYVTYGVWTTTVRGATTSSFTSHFAASGIQTSAASMPLTGSATYTGVADGAALAAGQTYRLLGSTGTLNANFATGAITTTLALRGNPDVTSDAIGTTNLGTLTGSAAIGAGTNKYSGTITGTGLSGTLTGAFFGPAAAETGYSFQVSGGGNAAAGVFVGKK